MKLAFRLLLILLPLGGMAQTPQDSLRVLWVGNSFSYCNDLPGMVQKIASTQKVKLSCTRFLKGGERFSGHLKNKKLLQAIADGGKLIGSLILRTLTDQSFRERIYQSYLAQREKKLDP